MRRNVVVVGSVCLAVSAVVWWIVRRTKRRRAEKAAKAAAEAKLPAPDLKSGADNEDRYDEEVAHVMSSLPEKEARAFGRVFDALGSLIDSCPSDEGSRQLSHTAFIAIACRNRIWGLSDVLPYAHSLAFIEWADQEMDAIISEYAPSPEWLKAGRNMKREMFRILRKTAFEARRAS